MNFLAHLFLSGNDEDVLIGNFIADYVKGNKKDDYPNGIRHGIELHRAIDDFTDRHEITGQSRRRLYERHHKYSGVVVDLYYDHFLARHFGDYSGQTLIDFSQYCYRILSANEHKLPAGVQYFLPYMISHDWLGQYATVEGIGRTLTGLGKRVRFENRMAEAGEDLEEHYPLFEAEFRLFFPQLITFAAQKR